jgi:hypothetical protein
MKLDISHIEFSRKDTLREIRLPSSLTSELAEFIGIMVGDGHLGFYFREKLNITSSEIKIACNSNGKEYIEYIISLFQTLFHIPLKPYKDKRSDTIILTAYSKCIVQFLNQQCGIPLNNKNSSVRIPSIIKNESNDIKIAFVRGLADTDFSLSFKKRKNKGYIYPVIRASFKSKGIIEDLERCFTCLGFTYSCIYDVIRHDNRFEDTCVNELYLNGKPNFGKWIKKIGFSNLKNKRKAEKWLKDGACPPGY